MIMANNGDFDISLVKEEVDIAVENRRSKSTKSAYRLAENLLHEYTLVDKEFSLQDLTDKQTTTSCQLDNFLSRFYSNARKKDGEKYSKKSLVTIRFGLQQLFNKMRDDDIINDTDFKKSKETFKAILVSLKLEGKAETKHKDIISETDLKKLYNSEVLSIDNPDTLLNKVFLDNLLHFSKRGRENLRAMKKTDFRFCTDSNGRRYVTDVSKLSKNRRDDDDDYTGSNRMYEDKGNPRCPFAAFIKYMSKLHPDCDAFFQRPLTKVPPNKEWPWYANQALGHNRLGTMMYHISEKANLSQNYTNFCFRDTCITVMDVNGFESRHIMGISKNKSESTLQLCSSGLGEQGWSETSNIVLKADEDSHDSETMECDNIKEDPVHMNADNMGSGCCKSKENTEVLDVNTREEIMNNLIEKNTELENENLRLKEKCQASESELKRIKHEFSEMIGKDIEMCAKDNFNNTSDPLQPVNISKRCEDMFDTEWRNVMIHLFKHDEEKGIQFLSEILQDCQTFCQQTAQTQISKFTNPCSPKDSYDVKDVLASEEDVHSLYKIRRKVGQFKATKESVIECFYNQCIESEKVTEILASVKDYIMTDSCKSVHENDVTYVYNDVDNDEERTNLSMEEKDIEMSTSTRVDPVEYLDAYIKNCTDMCWQAAISDPPVYFKFDVLGKHIDDIKAKFYQYSGKISGGIGQAKTVKTVVWPAVVKTSSGGREVLIANKKGCVILYDDSTSL
ncbi:AP-2 complex subunit sigma [Mactra antiquata]